MLLSGYSRTRGNGPLSDVPKRLALIRTLLENGADVHAVHKDSTNNALFFAKQRNAAEIIALLEQFGAREHSADSAQRPAADFGGRVWSPGSHSRCGGAVSRRRRQRARGPAERWFVGANALRLTG